MNDDSKVLAERFEENRARLRAVAYRMLGSPTEAEDAVQETWLRLSRSDADAIDNLAGWLTTVVGRVCLDMLRARTHRREDPLDLHPGDEAVRHGAVRDDAEPDPEQEAILADSVGAALLVVLDSLSPAERLAFVLHDMFAVPFSDIAAILNRSTDATKMLASRARRRVRGTTDVPETDHGRQRQIVQAFLAASREGDFSALLELLAPDVVLTTDDTALQFATASPGAPPLAAQIRGRTSVAEMFRGRARNAALALIDGAVGAVVKPAGKPRVAFRFTVQDGQIVGISIVADPAQMERADVQLLTPEPHDGSS
ncbi:sigma-70 family RNA polymerase sigma factor [Phytoactinopolyspora halotolerans]|uniref:Sigma-70 family RNA polymerase sigma factor n=1 Tax=Phytoactinopolyspora halotolerans TaxID=1981512 RepID=A0A6L9S3V2_9ACTN|nr:sigma-70 family RNA polymerase sigma factor [Phytoactinopolyspora halotolerans]NEE00125.1 sigma-70 family RNA polymerase sigma factor [Phytoactinopolyspora halotolerans]